ncbi:MAG TPA: lysylphosphatidylglycerol synthase transmembrane domain-containing protein, partial [Polyangiales bacterium]|nr:lysylphosphatidylglycerol synthase transmembrane domain-containing protein [Polyangiales bacterium]
LFNNLLPSNIGGDAVRLVYLKNLKSDNWGTPFMLLLLHRLSGFVVLVFSGLFYLALEHDRLFQLAKQQHVPLSMGHGKGGYVLIAAVVGIALAALVIRKLQGKLRGRVVGFLQNCRAAFLVVPRRDFVWLMVHTFFFHFSRMLAFYFLVEYLGEHVSLWDLVFVISATGIVAVIPLTIAGVGLVEGSISGLLALFGVANDPAVAVALLNRVVLILMAAIGGVVYASTRDQLVPTRSDAAPVSEPASPTA